MNTRDPFSLRRASPTSPFASVQSSFARAASAQSSNSSTLQVSDKEDLTSASTMSQPVARHAHSSSNDQQYGSNAWQPRKQQQETQLGGFEEKFNELFGAQDGLPMYKDKPYNYSSSRRRQPIWKQRRLLLPVVVAIMLLLYWSGLFASSRSDPTPPGTRTKSGRKSWNLRREKVREAFKRSWKAYETHAWGKTPKALPMYWRTVLADSSIRFRRVPSSEQNG